MTAAIVLLTLFVLITVFYLQWKNKYWSRKGVQTYQTRIFFGSMYDIVTNKTERALYFVNLYRHYKPKGLKYFGFYVFTSPALVLTDLNIVKSVLQSDFQYFCNRIHYVNEKNDPLTGHLFRLKDTKWKKLRTKLTPTFTSAKMKTMFHTLLDCSNGLINIANNSTVKNQGVDIKNIFMRYTTDVIVSCAFGIDCNSLEHPECEFMKYARMIRSRNKLQEFKEWFSVSFPWIADIFKMRLINPTVADFFMDLVKQTIHLRETTNLIRYDFMNLLIQLKNNIALNGEDDLTRLPNRNTCLSLEEMAAQAYVFFLAGYETSSLLLTFCFYELSLNADVQDKLRNEIKVTLNKYNGKITYEALTEMSYMDLCIKETLRKYPPVTLLNRECTMTYKVPGTNLIIDKDTQIVIPVLAIHTDEDYYPNPEIFDPERFATKEYPFSWLPFGEGPRNCIGLRFGLMQAKVALTSLLSKFKFTVNKKTEVPTCSGKT